MFLPSQEMSTATSWLFKNSSSRVSLAIGSSIAAALVYTIAKHSLQTRRKIIPSPRDTVLPILSKEEQDCLPYPPDVFPGARDVVSPYGTIRVYEFGPENGKKILFLHGISTPCIAFYSLAHGLVSKGCRVLLFDIFGRGYSDSFDLPHDSRLYTTEVLLAITSSKLPWTPGGFIVVGYSLGGGIAADFAAYFPEMVKGVVLMAPGGLIRARHLNWQSRLIYSSWLPDAIIEWIVRGRLRNDVRAPPLVKKGDEEKSTISEDVKDIRDPTFEETVISKDRPEVTIGSVVEWQLRHHGEGFIKSFISSMRYASISGNRETWRKLGLRKDKVMIIVGSEDSVINATELYEDAIDAIGEENVEWRVVQNGHEFPVAKPDEVLQILCEFWDL